jgi:hypothetical protein
VPVIADVRRPGVSEVSPAAPGPLASERPSTAPADDTSSEPPREPPALELDRTLSDGSADCAVDSDVQTLARAPRASSKEERSPSTGGGIVRTPSESRPPPRSPVPPSPESGIELARQLAQQFAQEFAGAAAPGPPLPGARLAAAPPGSLPKVPLPPDPNAPWLSPRAALQTIRSVSLPFVEKEGSYPQGTRIIARGNVRAEANDNFISNGDFSRGDVMWSVRSWQGFGDSSVAAYYSVQAGALCTALGRNEQVVGGWPWDDRRLSPSSFELQRGKRYRLSLRAWSAGPEPVELVVKVGHQKEPYTPAVVAKVPLEAEPGLFDIDFVAGRRDGSAGFAFVATAPPELSHSEFCIDDVSVRLVDAGR